MALRIAIGGIGHETNTYCSGTTPLEQFEIYRGADLLKEAESHLQPHGWGHCV